MKKIYILLLTITSLYLTSCSNPKEKVETSIKSYLKAHLKNLGSYESISFSKIDTSKLDYEKSKKELEVTLKDQKELRDVFLDNLEKEKKESIEYPYLISHEYYVINTNKDKVKMLVGFRFDKDFKIDEKSVSENINGECGSFAGVVYWKYNDYVGNKPDIGSKVELYSLDTIRGNLKYETSVDAQGNYKLEKVLPGSYLLILQSKNTTVCPEKLLQKLVGYSSEIKQLFNFDIDIYKTQLDEIHNLDSIAGVIIEDKFEKYNPSERLAKFYSKQKESRDKAEKLIQSFPNSFTSKIGIYTGYTYSLEFSSIRITESKVENNNTDFGITCI